MNVRIEKDGRVSKFEIAKPSENATVNESVAAVAKQISQVDPPPTGLIKGDHYDVKINFELNTERETGELIGKIFGENAESDTQDACSPEPMRRTSLR